MAKSCREICTSYLHINKKVKQQIAEATDEKTEKLSGPISGVLKKLVEAKNPGWKVVEDENEDGWYVEKKVKTSEEKTEE